LTNRSDDPCLATASSARQVDELVKRAAVQIWQSVPRSSDPILEDKSFSLEMPEPAAVGSSHPATTSGQPSAPTRSTPQQATSTGAAGDDTWLASIPLAMWLSKQWQVHLSPYAKPALRWCAIGFGVWFAIVLALIALYRFVNPPISNTMLFQQLSGRNIQHDWVPLNKMSTSLIKAVVVAEDARFCQHWGIDIDAIQYAIEHAGDGTPRGASTISMQTAKNLFLWSSKSYIRKILEVPVTLAMEIMWPKRRMLEIYLNIAEWGPGVFGIGAAARHHFKTRPASLGPGASALLAAALPNPIVRKAGRPGPKTRAKARVVQARARNGGQYIGCVGR
jgi:monofunctional biosynthetic peptidoglycan transglycosylase